MGKVLLTGGLGYIGSHTAVELLDSGYEVVIIDNLSNSKIDVVEKIKEITGKDFAFYQEDLCNKEALNEIFEKEDIESVIHLAGYKAVGESCEKPLMYYQNNLISTMNLLEVMQKHKVKSMVFSSSACVYGAPEKVPVDEEAPIKTTNPYGRTKVMIEEMLSDIYDADKSYKFAILRYFNPIGAHESGLIGEDCNGTPNNLMPYITQVAVGKLDHLNIFGKDYETPDGTGVRDFIHVVDLAKGHIKALEKIENSKTLFEVYNLGTGKGYSVLEIVKEFNKICGNKVKYEFAKRREGDVAMNFARVDKAKRELNWSAEKTLTDMCESSYKFQEKLEKQKAKEEKEKAKNEAKAEETKEEVKEEKEEQKDEKKD